MKKILLIYVLCLVIFIPTNVLGNDTVSDIMKNQLESLELKELEDISQNEFGFSFKKLVTDIVSGKYFSVEKIVNTIVNRLFSDVNENRNIIRNLIIVGILSAMLTNVSTAFTSTDVSSLAFYVCYVVIVSILYASFSLVFNTAFTFINSINTVVVASMPVVYGTLVLSGNPAYLAGFGPIVLVFSNVIIVFVTNIILPLILSLASLELINNITEKEILSLFTKTARQALSWVMKIICTLFVTVLTMQRVTAPMVDGLVSKAAKFSVNVVPVVGGALSGAVDTVLYIGKITKNSAMIGIIALLILYIGIYFIKIVSFLIVYKVVAICMEPIGDKRIVKTINIAGDYVGYLLSCCAIVGFMSIFSLMMVISL